MRNRLYHVSRDWKSSISVFIPRIPKSRASKEDNQTPRICTSTSITGCIIAHPKLHWEAWGQVQDGATYDVYNDMAKTSVLINHGNIYGYLMRCYVFDVEDEYIFTSSKIKEKKLLLDVDQTDEHWIVKDIVPTNEFYVLLQKMEFKNNNWDIQYRCFEKNNIGKVSDLLTIHNLERAI